MLLLASISITASHRNHVNVGSVRRWADVGHILKNSRRA